MPPAWMLAMVLAIRSPAEVPRAAWVSAESVDLLDEPDDAAFSTGRLKKGKKVTIRRDGPDGWATVDPPPGSFSLIDEADIEDLGDGKAKVTAPHASVHPGRDGLKRPGPARVVLRKGETVRLLERRPLVLRRGGESQTWLPIRPPRNEVRYIRADGLSDFPEPESAAPSRRDRLVTGAGRDDLDPSPDPQDSRTGPTRPSLPPLPRIDAKFASPEPEEPDLDVSHATAQAIAAVASRHRDALRLPLERWDLAPIEAAYRELLSNASGSDRRAIEARLAKLARQAAVASAARRMEAAIRRSRSRDAEAQDILAGEGGDVDSDGAEYDASGLLQSTARLIDGRRAFALVGDDGMVSCYLSIPPGLPVRELLARRVGVRGEGRYDENLRSRLILVRDLEPLVRKP